MGIKAVRIFAVFLAVSSSAAAMAQRSTDLKPGQQERHYDNLHRHTGRTERSSNGEYRHYDRLSRLQGTSRDGRDGSRVHKDALGRTTGRSERR